ncbi:BrnT family toxin [Oscillatoria sp. FACHB-1406]|uniref:BrnT family toxin n=1 Tax=Oscillatoria sp. FACHB-1406 TaxID=2692846 RepID=UPI0016849D07|nr:BrnT family toxin [Oscillatoria sp. FACHB-1406]MBD2578072.1 BrnT family toxin [Oscillatoria sp. FACHB-1406]
MIPGFEWNEEKARTNLKKHGVSFTEAATVFDDPYSLIMDDPKHSFGEARFIILGYSAVNRLLLVVHCDRGATILIVSARGATPFERRYYERGF